MLELGSEHQWLARLSGKWTFESECQVGPDQPPAKTAGRVTGRSLGGLWIVLETEGKSADGDGWQSIMQLGYDPQRQRYVGAFVASMMTHLWVYSGSIDDSTGKLVLDTEGPRFDQQGMARYQDIIEIVGDDHWTLSSQLMGDDGAWHPFMVAHHHRDK
jgi:hypothetical protein